MALNSSTGTLGDAAPALGAFPANHSYFVKEFIEIAAPEALYDMFGNSRAIPKNNSNSISYNKVAKLATLEGTALTEGVTPTEQQLTLTRISKTVDQYGGFITVTDRLQDESVAGLMSELNTRNAEQAAETMNLVKRDDLLGGTNVRYANAAANQNAITASGVFAADFDFMYQAFLNEKVKAIRPMTNGSPNINTTPTRETYPSIVKPSATTLLEALDDSNGNTYINTERYASQRPTWMNEHGTFKQFSFITDTESAIVSNAAATPQDINQSLVLGKGAYDVITIADGNVQIIMKPLGSAGTADPLDQRATLGWKSKCAIIIKQQTYMFRYEFSVGAT